MPENMWFRVPAESSDSIQGPKYSEEGGIIGFSGNTIGSSPQWVVRFYGDTAILDDIAESFKVTS